jgi:hypothetical protein
MQVFCHHVYEYLKGLRGLILHTTVKSEEKTIKEKLEINGIEYLIYEIPGGKINVFFGSHECIEVIRCIGKRDLRQYTAEEDFILGIMLGYARDKQCERYLSLCRDRKILEPLAG